MAQHTRPVNVGVILADAPLIELAYGDAVVRADLLVVCLVVAIDQFGVEAASPSARSRAA